MLRDDIRLQVLKICYRPDQAPADVIKAAIQYEAYVSENLVEHPDKVKTEQVKIVPEKLAEKSGGILKSFRDSQKNKYGNSEELE